MKGFLGLYERIFIFLLSLQPARRLRYLVLLLNKEGKASKACSVLLGLGAFYSGTMGIVIGGVDALGRMYPDGYPPSPWWMEGALFLASIFLALLAVGVWPPKEPKHFEGSALERQTPACK